MTTSKRLMTLFVAIGLAMGAKAPVLAQMDHGKMHGAPPAATKRVSPDKDPAVRGYVDAMERMHAAMSKMQYSGNADVDFARGMIPHHQAAIDMAQIVLKHGTNPEIRRLAEEIIAAQEKEIGQLEAWLRANAGR